MSNKMPFFFKRFIRCTDDNGLVPNDDNGKERITCVVMLADCWDMKYYDASWMGNENLTTSKNSDDDYTLVPDIDLTDYNNIYTFSTSDRYMDETMAINKMKELWASI